MLLTILFVIFTWAVEMSFLSSLQGQNHYPWKQTRQFLEKSHISVYDRVAAFPQVSPSVSTSRNMTTTFKTYSIWEINVEVYFRKYVLHICSLEILFVCTIPLVNWAVKHENKHRYQQSCLNPPSVFIKCYSSTTLNSKSKRMIN